jgi:hypothetical protein
MNSSKTSISPLVAAFVLLLLMSWLTTGWKPMEDSYISFRYAAHAALGHGFVFNPGERVEGYTNFLWTALLAGGGIVRWKAIPQIALILELLFGLGAVWVLWKWRRSAFAVLLLAVFPGFGDNIGLGLEAALLAFLLTLGAYCLFDRHRTAAGSALLGLAFLARPDYGLVGLLLLATAWLATPKAQRNLGSLLRLVAPWALLVAGMELFRFWYYGDVVPNTFHAKAGIDFKYDLALGANSLWFYLKQGGFAFVVLLVLVATAARRNIVRLGVVATVAVFVAYDLLVGGPSGNPSRFLAPLIPLLLAIFPWANPDRFGRTSPVLLAFATLLGTVATVYAKPAALDETKNPAVDIYELVSLAVQPLPAKTSVVFQAIGRVGWENMQLRLVDPLALTNRQVARYGASHPEIPIQGHRKWMTADQFFAARPDYYVPFSPGTIKRGRCPDNPTYQPRPGGPDIAVMSDPRLLRQYTALSLSADHEGCVLAFRRNP